MKKIISFFISSILFFVSSFSVFAEVKVSLTFKTRPYLFSTDLNTFEFFDLDGYNTTSSAFTVKANNEMGGVEFEIDPAISIVTTTSDSGTSTTAVTKSMTVEKYNGWVNFGDFTFKAGAWDARSVILCTKSSLAFEGMDFAIIKPGMISSVTSKKLGVDISEQCGLGTTKQLTAMLQYSNNGFEGRFAVLNSAGENYALTDNIIFKNNGFFLETGYSKKSIDRILISAKSTKDEYAGAIFLEPLFLKNVNVLLGVTGEMKSASLTSKANKDIYGYAFDFRMRWAVTKNFAVTTMNNYTVNQLDVAESASIKEGYAMENLFNIQYIASPELTLELNVRHYTGYTSGGSTSYKPLLLKTADASDSSKVDWVSNFRITPEMEYKFNNAAKLDVGVAINVLNVFANQTSDNDIVYKIQIPVVFQATF